MFGDEVRGPRPQWDGIDVGAFGVEMEVFTRLEIMSIG